MNKTQNLQTHENALSFVAFQINRRTFALPLSVIVQILPMMTIIPIPHASRIVKGTINVHGQSVVVVSLRAHFGMEEEALQLYTPMLLVNLRDRTLALIVDEMREVLSIHPDAITNLDSLMPDGIQNIPMLHGLFYNKDETILLLDPEKLFHISEQVYVERVHDIGPILDQIPNAHQNPDLEAGAPVVAESAG